MRGRDGLPVILRVRRRHGEQRDEGKCAERHA
jgi:hypothetical protein